ncbi:TetR/AcrR family transcriptional regulator [Bowmanella yangjiangensis]|uniref:TetR/AcrR family transcriptional regulator n=1 Tax=Bowmanella yangjiangensis TaxID=2811230 RepID=A0ABS3CMY1_9ALTE|nr:TetR/AcrR family transcriptional regulator [Bowmanella yangjiangensis]MBN7818468.1 TetR/AcrR family transcriptional regulator [Bowmanella yangjiangensis]
MQTRNTLALDQLNLQYTGRPTKRKDSKERRDSILSAALTIMVRDGIREVRHRSVAKEAQVPLSATTYYFDTIECLIHDAFVYFTEQNASHVQLLERSAWIALEEFERHADKKRLKGDLLRFLVSHIENQVQDKDARIVEWSFRQEALRNEKLAELYQYPQLLMTRAIESFFTGLGQDKAQERAQILLGTLYHLEYQLLTNPWSGTDIQLVESVLSALLAGPLFELG